MPLGGGQTYTFLRLRGKEVAALSGMDPERRQQGVPSHWMPYLAVESADQAVSLARALGGKVLVEPFDVMDVGRMAVVQDPSGATVSLWQPRKHRGSAIIGEPGSPCWFELSTRDIGAASGFYTKLLGWSSTSMPMPGGASYTVFNRDGQNAAGLMAMPAAGGDAPPAWLSYFATADCQGTVDRARALGGQVVVPPTDMGSGRFAVLQDPQGAMFGLLMAAPAP